ncbi:MULTISPECIES: penicillin-binding protein activator [unclassified Mesorhizobium]|uniref:penicillin-binding protein activator n=2 Tax=Mesorhizobium TaxID=68287 RepID=UPI000FCCC709|nr:MULTISPECIES: penicillin-binding protein activator [unclassified Mesorhizobium]RUW40337.1 ABC transporter substrate-binding protein [Mesorhizobium sp. M2A.F.Ca.ET.015.02.1.1]RVD11420.1 ABC transporter substrate-binding protein [Mesorhizobium sp. M2A.F.Ca.ET.029.05.1.1]RWB49045.1 MAG: ABC transporter substrate-binding protein [Mesorhizobium sp.]RWB64351.1 MAG: ABC transporter substrate-binding protein [Mesorhizobium sp.]RWB90282.1 MAG: ABC transporter substrate-binding protein [Mesorhizobium
MALALVVAATASGCQSKSGASDVLDPSAIAAPAGQAGAAAAQQASSAAPGNPAAAAQGAGTATSATSSGPTSATAAKANLTLGTGPTKVTMLLPLSAPGSTGENGRKMYDGARLAMADLGDKLLTLTIQDTRGDSGYAKDLAVKAITSGTAKVVVGPAELAAAQHLAKLSGSKRPPVLALADNFAGGPGVYSVRLSEADSAAAGAAAIAGKGARKFVLMVPAGADSSAVESRVANALSIYGATLAVTLPYSPTDGGAKVVSDMGSLVEAPDAVVVACGDGSPAAVLAALKAKGIPGKTVTLIGTDRWLERPVDPLYEGAYIATLDQSETGPIADRFKATYNYQPDVNVAYAYDMVALSAGIASSAGPDGFNKQVLENTTGFRGSTGLFRFRSDGSSQRSMPFFKVEKGQLKLVEKQTAGF